MAQLGSRRNLNGSIIPSNDYNDNLNEDPNVSLYNGSNRLLAYSNYQPNRNSVYSNATSLGDVLDNPLFPRVNQTQRHSQIKRRSYYDSNLDIDEDDQYPTSVENLGQVFNRNNETEYDLSNSQNLFQTNFDSENDLESRTLSQHTSNVSDISLDSSVINKVGKSLDSPAPESNDRFKFLSLYQNFKKEKNQSAKIQNILTQMKTSNDIPMETINDKSSLRSSHSSIFGLSKLEDYTKYVKLTEINEIIKKKIMSQNDSNVLSIVNPNQLAANYMEAEKTPPPFSNTKKIQSNLKKPSWYNKDWYKKKNQDVVESNIPAANSASPESSIHKQEISNSPNYLQRKLKVRHLQMISLGGTLGVGLYLNSGKAITIAGGFGTTLAYIICGIIVLCTIVSFCEMVTFVSVVDGVSGLSSRFVDDSFGFSVGWLYFLSFAFGLAGEVVASVILLTYFPDAKILTNKGSTVGFVALFLLLILFANLVDVRVFGEIEYFSSLIKLICALLMIILMIVLNRGGLGNGTQVLGFRYWDYLKLDFDHNLIFGLFRPSFNLNDTGTNDPNIGIGGDKGRFLSLMAAMMVVAFAYSGTEIVCIAACEAKNPRIALPSATKRVFWRILIFYILSSFLVSLNIYAGDPRLLRFYSGSTGTAASSFESNYAVNYVGGEHCSTNSTIFAGFGSGLQSPWTVALQLSGLCKLSSVANGFLTFFAVSCGNSQLYVASRTMYSLALQKKAPRCLAYCNRSGIPYNSVLLSAAFGLLAFLCVSEKATVVFQNLTSLIASSGIMVWFAMCLSFLRFFYGMKLRPDIISRDDKSYPYKSPFQPYCAYIGLIGSTILLLGMGFAVFMKDEWDTLYFFSSYGTLIIFAVLYIGYRLIRGNRTPSLETLDFDSGRREMDRYIWDGGREYNARNLREVTHKFISVLA